jgi:hypothetical protein
MTVFAYLGYNCGYLSLVRFLINKMSYTQKYKYKSEETIILVNTNEDIYVCPSIKYYQNVHLFVPASNQTWILNAICRVFFMRRGFKMRGNRSFLLLLLTITVQTLF